MSEFDLIVRRLRDALANAQRRVDTLRDLVEAVEKARIHLPDDLLNEALKDIGPQLGRIAPEVPEEQSTVSGPQRIRGDLPPREIAALARDTLLAVGKPLKRGQLVREMDRRGVPLAGTDKNKNLGTILWRHREMFVSLPKLGYWPKGVPLAGAYDPETFVDDADHREGSD